jgi:hypothetical protein
MSTTVCVGFLLLTAVPIHGDTSTKEQNTEAAGKLRAMSGVSSFVGATMDGMQGQTGKETPASVTTDESSDINANDLVHAIKEHMSRTEVDQTEGKVENAMQTTNQDPQTSKRKLNMFGLLKARASKVAPMRKRKLMMHPPKPKGRISGKVRSFSGKPIGGAILKLIGFDLLGLPFDVQTTKTIHGGEYKFDRLEAGFYIVEETNAPGYPFDISVNRQNVTLAADAKGKLERKNIDFVDAKAGSITGFVRELKVNGARLPVPGAVLVLFDDDDRRVATSITDKDGKYEFTDLPPGDYLVFEMNNDDLIDVQDYDTFPDGDVVDKDKKVDSIIKVTLKEGELDKGNDFLDAKPPPTTKAPTLAPVAPTPAPVTPSAPTPSASTTSAPTLAPVAQTPATVTPSAPTPSASTTSAPTLAPVAPMPSPVTPSAPTPSASTTSAPTLAPVAPTSAPVTPSAPTPTAPTSPMPS